jgi:hypothetical protein
MIVLGWQFEVPLLPPSFPKEEGTVVLFRVGGTKVICI